MTPVVVTGRHRPHEVTFLVFSLLFGLALVTGVRPPGSIEEELPAWLRWVWYLLLLVSGALGVAGLLHRDVYYALVLERAAMWGQAGAFTTFALGIFAFGGWRGLGAGGLCVALTVASLWRLRQVFREIGLVRRAAGSGET